MTTQTNTKQKPSPQATASDYRLPIFGVAKRKVNEISTRWGDVRIERGNPTARHRDLLDAIITVATKRMLDQEGNVHVFFDTVDVAEILGKKLDWRDIKEALLDLQSTVYSTKSVDGKKWVSTNNILIKIEDAKTDATRRDGQFAAKLKKIVISEDSANRLVGEVNITINKSTMAILLKLDHQVSKALARWCLSHSSEQHHSLQSIFEVLGLVEEGEAIGGRVASSTTYNYIKQLKNDSEGLDKLGISISNKTVHYIRGKGVFISL